MPQDPPGTGHAAGPWRQPGGIGGTRARLPEAAHTRAGGATADQSKPEWPWMPVLRVEKMVRRPSRRATRLITGQRGPDRTPGGAQVEARADREAPDRNLALELVRVTEAAAMAAARKMGFGDKEAVDQAAVDAMR